MRFGTLSLVLATSLAPVGLVACAGDTFDPERAATGEQALRDGAQTYEGFRFDGGRLVFENDAVNGREAALAIFNKYYGCEVNQDAQSGRDCGAGSSSCQVARKPFPRIISRTTNVKDPSVALCGPTWTTNWPWREQMIARLGQPRDWNPNDAANGAWDGARFHPFVALNRAQRIWYATFERGQLYAFEDWGRGGYSVFEVADVPGAAWYSWYAKRITPNGTNSFLGVPMSGHESGQARCGVAGSCMSFARFATPDAEGGPECLYKATTATKNGRAVIHVDTVAPWDGPSCAVPAALQDLPNARF